MEDAPYMFALRRVRPTNEWSSSWSARGRSPSWSWTIGHDEEAKVVVKKVKEFPGALKK